MNGANPNRKNLKSIAFFLINYIDKILSCCKKFLVRIGNVNLYWFESTKTVVIPLDICIMRLANNKEPI